jgi:hypothetical protein
MHDPREISLGCLQKEMVMVLHEAIDVNDDPKSLMGFSQTTEEEVAVLVAKKDRLSAISPGHYVIERAGIFDPARLGHLRGLQSMPR